MSDIRKPDNAAARGSLLSARSGRANAAGTPVMPRPRFNPMLGALASRPEPDPKTSLSRPETDATRPTVGQSGANETPREPPAENTRDEWRPLVNPVSVFRGIGRSKRLIAATTIAGALLGVMLALSTPKKYEATGDLLVDPRDIKLVDRELVSSSLSMEAALAIVENQIRILTSSMVADDVVDKLDLMQDPEFNGSSNSFGFRSLLSELRALLTRRDGSSGSARTHAIAVKNLLESLDVRRDGKTFVVAVSATTEDPEKSALIANTVMDTYIGISGNLLSTAAGRATRELSAKLDSLRNEVEEAEQKIEDYKRENDLIDARGRLIGDDEIIGLSEQLAVSRARTIELAARARSARAADVDAAIASALPEGIGSGVITELRAQYADLMREANKIAVKLGPRHPKTEEMAAQLEGARDQISAELRRIVASIQTELKRAVELEQQLAGRLAALKVRQSEVNDDLVKLRQLERESASRRAVYEAYLLRAKETGEQQGLNSANISIISDASPPLDPTGPSRSFIAITGMLAGMLFGIGIGAIRGALDDYRPGGGPSPNRPRRPTASSSETRSGGTRNHETRDEQTSRLKALAKSVATSNAATKKPETDKSQYSDSMASSESRRDTVTAKTNGWRLLSQSIADIAQKIGRRRNERTDRTPVTETQAVMKGRPSMEHQPESPAAKLQLLARSIEGIVTQIRRRTARREPQFETAPIGAKQEFPDDHESVRLRKLSRSIAHIAEQVKRKNASRAGPAIVEPENRDTENFAGELTRPSEFDTLSDLLEEIVKDSRRAEIPESKPRAAPSAETTDPDRFEQRIRELHAMAQSLTMQSSAANHNDPAFSGSSKKRSSARNDGSEIERQKPSGFDDEWTNEPENPVENSRDAARATDTGRRYENDPQVATIARFPRSRSDERSEPSRRVHGESRSGYADPEPAQHRYAPAQQFPQPHFAQPQPVYFPPAQPGPPLQPCAPAPGPYGQPWSAQPVWQSYPMPVQQPPFHPQPMVAPQYYIWPQHPSPAYPAHPGYAPDQAPYVRPESAPPPDQPGRYHTDPVTRAQFEEIKESLREFQGALYDLSDQRTLRRA